MIKEYALDPHMEYNADKLRYYAEKFSLEQGRLIARFPKRWSKRLRENLQSRLPEVARKRAEFFLSRLEERIYDGKRPYNDEIDWLMNAENDHGRVPFAGIITRANPRSHEAVMIDEDLTENHPRMVVPRWHSVPRTPRDLANFLAPVLKEASLIRLVDPYFEPRPDERDGYRATKWTRPLVAFYSQMRSAGNIEYHTLLHSKRPWNGKAWEQACCAELPHVLPAGMRLTVLLWEEKKPGLQFHARYIFTDRYAVLVDPGLDALVDGHGQTTNFGFLSEQDRQGLEEQFSHDATTYRLLAKHEILGVGDCLGEAHLRGLR